MRRVRADAVLNATDPRFNKPIFDAAFEARATYLDMAMTLSHRHPNGGISLGVGELLELMMVDSDNTAADVLMKRIGGPGAVTAWLRMRAVRLLVMTATTRKKNSVTTFSGSAIVKV